MPQGLPNALLIILALACAGLAHLLWLRTRLAQRFNWPIDGGLRLRGHRLFGDNKKARGFVVLPIAAALSFGALPLIGPLLPRWLASGLWPMASLNYAGLGYACGMAFMLAELPNSFIKRQLNIAAGEPARTPSLKLFFLLFDRCDSALGVLIATTLLVPTPPMTWVWIMVLGPLVHTLFSALQHRMGLKNRSL